MICMLCKAAAPLAVKSAEFPADLPARYHSRFIGGSKQLVSNGTGPTDQKHPPIKFNLYKTSADFTTWMSSVHSRREIGGSFCGSNQSDRWSLMPRSARQPRPRPSWWQKMGDSKRDLEVIDKRSEHHQIYPPMFNFSRKVTKRRSPTTQREKSSDTA